jgi:hypothetical protein
MGRKKSEVISSSRGRRGWRGRETGEVVGGTRGPLVVVLAGSTSASTSTGTSTGTGTVLASSTSTGTSTG